MKRTTAVEALEAIKASVAALAEVIPGAGFTGPGDPDPLRQQSDGWLDTLAVAARLQAATAALVVHAAAGFTDTTRAMASPNALPQGRIAQEMAVVAEVACVLTVSERTAGALLSEAHELTTTLPLTLAALQDGNISWQHARAMVDETASLNPAGAAALEAHFLDPDAPNPAQCCPAGELVPSRFRHKARTWRERHHPDSIEKRHTKSALDRWLEFAPDRDGMAWLSAYLPADQAAGIWDRTTTAARALQGPHEDRNLSQIRADVAAGWLLGGTAEHVPSPSAQVLVTVPVFALMGLTDEPAMLDGYGPIPTSMASRLMAESSTSFHRVLTDPRDGAPLEIGRTSYRIPVSMRQWLRLRDGKCPFPGCTNQSLDNEADHLLAWADGGTTGLSNLGQPCHKHHSLKHTTAWTPTGASAGKPPGWISPTGRQYASEQQDWEPPYWPPHIMSRLGHQELGPDVPEDILPAEPPASDLRPVDPVPEWSWQQAPLDEPWPEWRIPQTV
ncbi:HNH endonuclease [Pseudarthrobacter sp. MDT3-26]|uniref:HNH endonuclease signature motif containing protein n=1 Tax=Pseudarthrobacter raffinosi TaxID=2953651 RepID=UPI00208FA88C|nr:HNH endonuclease signature motif containing protein [Pseudarthrobacter sp. MDT3-26]MCO4262351.1 HNH endonuclease [Pseudarthrobacter sp. MDT3-26]